MNKTQTKIQSLKKTTTNLSELPVDSIGCEGSTELWITQPRLSLPETCPCRISVSERTWVHTDVSCVSPDKPTAVKRTATRRPALLEIAAAARGVHDTQRQTSWRRWPMRRSIDILFLGRRPRSSAGGLSLSQGVSVGGFTGCDVRHDLVNRDVNCVNNSLITH